MREPIDIPILGIDRRPVERQHNTGLCRELKGLRPAGREDEPYWVAEPDIENLTNDSGVDFSITDQDKIVRAAWHVRSSVGKYGTDGSLRRLVCLFDNGDLKIIDPNSGASGDEWLVVTTESISISGTVDCSFALMNNLLVVNVIDDKEPIGIYLVIDDLIVKNEIPDLPKVFPYREGDDYYTQSNYDNGIYDGLENGSVYAAYGFRFYDGTTVKISTPEQIGLPEDLNGTDRLTYRIKFYNDGYRQTTTPDNVEFWNDQIESVVCLLGGYKPLDDSDQVQTEEKEDLLNIQFYEVASFPFLDEADKSREEQTVEFFDKAENISSYPLADVDSINNTLYAETISSYNARLILGGSSEDFPIPGVPFFNGIYDRILYTDDSTSGQLRIDVLGGYVELSDVTLDSNLSSAAVEAYEAEGTTYNRVTATIDATPWQITLDFGFYEIVLTDADVNLGGDPVSLDRYSLGVTMENVKIAVEIETSQGEFERVTPSDVSFYPYSATTSNYALSSFTYPDRRARRVYIWENDGGYTLKSVVQLAASNTQNFAFAPNFRFPDNGADYSKSVPSSTVNDNRSYYPNRVQISEQNNPYVFKADKTYYIGSGDGDRIIGFGVNTLDISSGQFGQYPLYIFFQNSIYALEQGNDPSIVFRNITPISLIHGANSDLQITNVGRSIVFVYKDGIFALSGGNINEIGQPIGNYPGEVAIDFSSLTLASRQRDGAYELLVSTGSLIYAMNMKFGAWYQINRSVDWFFDLNGQLYSVDSQGNIYDEQEEASSSVNFTVDLDPVHFGSPEMMKRLFALYIRGKLQGHTMSLWFDGEDQITTSEMFQRIRHSSAYKYRVRITGSIQPSTEYLQAITAKLEARYPHKTKLSV